MSLADNFDRSPSFGQWWFEKLDDLARRRHKASEWRVMILRTPEGFRLLRRARGKVEQLGDVGADFAGAEAAATMRVLRRTKAQPGECILRLGREDVVGKTLTLPAAARDDVLAILRNQIERLSPWPAHEAVFDYTIDPTDGDDQRIQVHAVVAGRARVEKLRSIIKQHGIDVGTIDYGEDAETPSTINLWRSLADAGAKPGRRSRTLLTFLLLAAIGVGGYGGWKAWQRYQELAAVEARVDKVRGAAQAAVAAERAMKELKQRSERLSLRKETNPPAALVLEALSRALPDDTWLTGLEMQKGEVRITGKSRNAAKLVGILEQSKAFREARFSGSTTVEAGGGLETFSISARPIEGLEAKP